MTTPAITPPTADSAPALEIPQSGTPEHKHWRMTGELPAKTVEKVPEVKETQETVTEEPSGAERSAEPAAASEAAQSQERRKRGDAAKRIQELLEENRKLRMGKVDDKPAPSAEPAKEAKPEAKDELVRPKIGDTDPATGKPYTWDAYEDALIEYSGKKAAKTLREETAKNAKQTEAETRQRSVVEDFRKNVEVARKEYADFDQVAFSDEIGKLIPKDSIIDHCILQTGEMGAKTLYFLGKHPEKVGEILKMKPFEQAAELLKIQNSLAKPLTPARQISKAPAAPLELGTNGTAVTDESERAVKQGDFKAYRAAENAKALAKRSKG